MFSQVSISHSVTGGGVHGWSMVSSRGCTSLVPGSFRGEYVEGGGYPPQPLDMGPGREASTTPRTLDLG